MQRVQVTRRVVDGVINLDGRVNTGPSALQPDANQVAVEISTVSGEPVDTSQARVVLNFTIDYTVVSAATGSTPPEQK